MLQKKKLGPGQAKIVSSAKQVPCKAGVGRGSASLVYSKLRAWQDKVQTWPVRSIPKTWAAEPRHQTVSFWLAELELQAQLSAGTARLKVAQLGFRFRFSKF